MKSVPEVEIVDRGCRGNDPLACHLESFMSRSAYADQTSRPTPCWRSGRTGSDQGEHRAILRQIAGAR